MVQNNYKSVSFIHNNDKYTIPSPYNILSILTLDILSEKALIRLIMRNWVNLSSINKIVRNIMGESSVTSKSSFGKSSKTDLAFILKLRTALTPALLESLGVNSLSNKNLLKELSVINTEIHKSMATKTIIKTKIPDCPICPAQRECPTIPGCPPKTICPPPVKCPDCPDCETITLPETEIETEDDNQNSNQNQNEGIANIGSEWGQNTHVVTGNPVAIPQTPVINMNQNMQNHGAPRLILYPSTGIFQRPPELSNRQAINRLIQNQSMVLERPLTTSRRKNDFYITLVPKRKSISEALRVSLGIWFYYVY